MLFKNCSRLQSLFCLYCESHDTRHTSIEVHVEDCPSIRSLHIETDYSILCKIRSCPLVEDFSVVGGVIAPEDITSLQNLKNLSLGTLDIPQILTGMASTPCLLHLSCDLAKKTFPDKLTFSFLALQDFFLEGGESFPPIKYHYCCYLKQIWHEGHSCIT
mmetsp:Transcript_36373/g.58805  ORF Transcript_36373/g.58805 Transcript_36373/m.58805 type:complete len:160 (-) Transcript_36373:565-1044(-)